MAGFRLFSSTSRSLLLHLTKQKCSGPFDPLIGLRDDGLLPFLRAISCHSSFSCGCKVSGVEKPTNNSRGTAYSNRFFHSTEIHSVKDQNYYEILGIPRSASQADIKQAFLALAKKYHPDTNRNNPAAKRKFQELKNAYETLRDTEKRAHYDMEYSRKDEVRSHNDDDANEFRTAYRDPFSDTFYKIFSEVFEHERDMHADDQQVVLSLSFSEAAKGCRKHVSFKAQVTCDSCYGRGHPLDAQPSRCPTCGGSGKVTLFPFTTTCTSCRGVGTIIKNYCLVCKGSGVVDGVKNIDVTIPAGVDSGDTIQVPKAGHQRGPGIQPGSLHIKLQVEKDPVFQREGADVYVDIRISFAQAILGGKVDVPTLSGITQVKIPRGVQHNQLLVLRGRGLPRQIGYVDHGDQYVWFHIYFPSSVNDRQREILEEFAKEEAIRESSQISYGFRWQQIYDLVTTPWFRYGIGILLLFHIMLRG